MTIFPNLYYWISKLRLKLTRRILPVLLALSVAVIVFGSAITWGFEHGVNPHVKTYWDAIWLSFITMTTVGYGDVSPITTGGKALGIVSSIVGIGFVGLFTATIATVLVERMLKEGKGMKPVRFTDHIVICGWNSRCQHLIAELKREQQGASVPIVLLANLEQKPTEGDDVFFVHGSPINVHDLEKANIEKAHVAILMAVDSDHSEINEIDAITVLSALAIRKLNPEIEMAAEILDPLNASHIENANVTEILIPCQLMGNVLARSALHHGIVQVVDDLTSAGYGNQIYKIPVDEELVGMEYSDAVAYLQHNYGYTILAVESGDTIVTNAIGRKINNSDALFIMAESVPEKTL